MLCLRIIAALNLVDDYDVNGSRHRLPNSEAGVFLRMVKFSIMELQDLLQSPRAGRIALGISRLLPPRVGYSLADFIADRIAKSSDTPMIKSVRVNQWVVSGQTLEGEALDYAVRETIRTIARSFYTLFHYLKQLEEYQELIEYSDKVKTVIANQQSDPRGLVIVGVHMSHFDLVAQSAARSGLSAFTLSVPQPNDAIEWQHEIRRRSGIEIVPATISNIRDTINRLKAGEAVLTGLDHPVSDPIYQPRFFGYPAHVPVHHIQLAVKARVPIIVFAAREHPDRRISVDCSDYIEMEEYPNRNTTIINNAENILNIAEDFIQRAPQQWIILQPVWPELTPLVP